MTRTMLVALMAALVACASQETTQIREEQDQAIRDFIAVRGLQELAKIRSSGSEGWDRLSDHFIIYNTRRGSFLFEFARRCYELDDASRVTPDVRADPNAIRARFETLRGCSIHKIYALTKAEGAELRELGEAPGSRNQ